MFNIFSWFLKRNDKKIAFALSLAKEELTKQLESLPGCLPYSTHYVCVILSKLRDKRKISNSIFRETVEFISDEIFPYAEYTSYYLREGFGTLSKRIEICNVKTYEKAVREIRIAWLDELIKELS